MDRKEFESLRLEEQIAYVNERPQMKMKEIAEEIGMPASSLSQLFSKAGYERVKGIYVKQLQEERKQIDLEELLQHKDEILMLLKERRQQASKQIDFSVLAGYEGSKRTVSFDLPDDLVKEMDAFVKATGYKKQAIFALAMHEFLENKRGSSA